MIDLELLKAKLKDEDYLETIGNTIDSIVDAVVVIFENDTKRRVDVTKSTLSKYFVRIDRLRKDLQKNFRENYVILH